MGIYLALSSLAYGTALLARAHVQLMQPEPACPATKAALETLQGLLTIAILISSVSLRRRPSVYVNGRKVDDMYSATLLSRLTWNWAWELPMFAQRWSKIDFDDMPVLPHWVRAHYLAALWGRVHNSRPLGLALARIYWKSVALQWMLAALHGATTVAVYWATLKLLETLEKTAAGRQIPPVAWLLVLWICLSTICGEVRIWISAD